MNSRRSRFPGLFPSRAHWLVCALALAPAFAAPAVADPDPPLRPDLSEQFLFGFEPTRTNLGMLFDSAYAVFKKALTGRGKGVLEIEGRSNTAARTRYLELLRRDCPECAITEVRESHGTISYRVTYPDRTYIGSSLDAGALEWQTMPATVSEIRATQARAQRHMYDLPKQAGAWMLLDALGGHVTESGYDDGMFWLASLKLDAETPELSWGFFGKDGYNATPVKMWASDQQATYRQVALEHDADWKKFLQTIEAQYAGGRPPTVDALMETFEKRRLMERKDLAGRMAGIYHNPKQESKLTGKRSKPKYVAHRPGIVGESILIVENRAVRPQNAAKDLELLARYRLRRAEYVKSWLDRGYDVDFRPGSFTGLSKERTAAQARAIIEELGLKWEDYAHFGPVKDPALTGAEKKLSDFFTPKAYGVAKRDELFGRVLDTLHGKAEWSDREWRFALALSDEHGNTVVKLERETRRLAERVAAMDAESLAIDALEARMRGIAKLVRKYRVPSARLYGHLRVSLQPAFERLWRENRTRELGVWAKYLADEELAGWATRARKLLHAAPEAAAFDFQAQLVDEIEFRAGNLAAHPRIASVDTGAIAQDWFESMLGARKESFGAIPESLERMHARLPRQAGLRTRACAKLVSAVLEFPAGTIREADAPALELLAREFPEREDAILAPLRKLYADELAKRGYGLTNHYEAIVLSDKLLGVTPLAEREAALRDLLAKVRAMHARKNDPDSKSFVERLEKEIGESRGRVCGAWIGSPIVRKLRGFLLGGFR